MVGGMLKKFKTLWDIYTLGRHHFRFSLVVLFLAVVGVTYLLRANQETVGFAIRFGSYLHFIAIHPRFKGKGHGKYLFRQILPKIRRLRVSIHNRPAIALYSKFGFRIVGTSTWLTGKQYVMER